MVDAPKGKRDVARATYELFAGMIEFSLSRRLTDIVTVADARVEQVLRRANWPYDCAPPSSEFAKARSVAMNRASTGRDQVVRIADGLTGLTCKGSRVGNRISYTAAGNLRPTLTACRPAAFQS